MSTLHYLNNQLKSDLTKFAETSHLQDYANLKKAELAEELDAHLRKNATTYGNAPGLSDYYQKLNGLVRSPTKKSPVKRVVEKVSDMVKSDDDDHAAVSSTARKSTRRRTHSPETDTEVDNVIDKIAKTPAKAMRRASAVIHGETNLVPSPAVVTDVIDEQTKRMRKSITHAYENTHVKQYTEQLRDYLSSTATVNWLAIFLEAFSLSRYIIGTTHLTTIRSIPFRSTPLRVELPDIFQLLTQQFWAHSILWALATIAVPALVSYFINIPVAQLPRSSSTRRAGLSSKNPHIQFDPFVFNVVKGLVAYLVFGLHVHLPVYHMFDDRTIEMVNLCMPGRYQGLLVSSGIGAAISLYEAILKKH